MPGSRKPWQVFHLLNLWVPQDEVPGNQLWARAVSDELELWEQCFPTAPLELSDLTPR